jgi:TetR/AcrR family fatty acid metabolism transcriptional regulator
MASSRRTPERRSVREESRAVYRKAIVDAAMQVFGQTGFHEAKIADIAAAAGVATGTLYNYFTSKDEIFQSILEDGLETLTVALEERAAIDDPLERLRGCVAVMFTFLEEHGALFSIHMQLGANPMDFKRGDDERDEVFRQRFLGVIANAIDEAGDRLRHDYSAEVMAWGLGGLMNGAILRWVHDGCRGGLSEHTDTIMDLFLNGATPR